MPTSSGEEPPLDFVSSMIFAEAHKALEDSSRRFGGNAARLEKQSRGFAFLIEAHACSGVQDNNAIQAYQPESPEPCR